MVAPLFANGGTTAIRFLQEDITRIPSPGDERYDVILCNGLLGGPLLHREEILKGAISALAGRLNPGGVLLAADRFHGGWKKEVPNRLLNGLLQQNGLTPISIEDGVAAEKPACCGVSRQCRV
jgi:hypothetical protein